MLPAHTQLDHCKWEMVAEKYSLIKKTKKDYEE